MLNIVREVRDGGLSEVDDTRCTHLYKVLEEIRDRNIPGDLVETGIYKGGCSIIMAWCNREFKLNKKVWCYDSFEGCPDPNETKLGKHVNETHGKGDFACDYDTVLKNFKKFDLIDDNVKFYKGWFEETTLKYKPESIALLRFDGDLYSSTLDVLNNLYPLVVSGGFVIIDDYCIEACRQATHEYLNKHNLKVEINTPMNSGDSCGSWWIKS